MSISHLTQRGNTKTEYCNNLNVQDTMTSIKAVTNNLRVINNAINGYVLTSDEIGTATWQQTQSPLPSQLISLNLTETMWTENARIVSGGGSSGFTVNANQVYNGYYSYINNGDIWENTFNVAPGTYTLKFLYIENTDAPTVAISIDGTLSLTIDMYAAAPAYNSISQITDIVFNVGAPCQHVLEYHITGKNASSSAYVARFNKAWLINQVTGELSILPTVLNFGEVATGQTGFLETTLTNIGAGNVTAIVDTITPSSGVFSDGGTVPASLAGDASATITFSFSPVSLGLQTANATISGTNSTTSPFVQLIGTGTGSLPASNLALIPTGINFGFVPIGASPVTQTFVVQNMIVAGGGTTLHNISFQTTQQNLYLSFQNTVPPFPSTLAPGESSSIITATFNPRDSGAIGLQQATYIFSANESSVSPQFILTGTGHVPAGILVATPNALDFGNVTHGGPPSTLTCGLRNEGDLNVSSITYSILGTGAAAYSVVGLPSSLVAGHGQSFNILFGPGATGQQPCVVTISGTYVGGITNTTVDCTGNGV